MPDFKFKVEFSDRTASDEVKKSFDSTENILVDPEKEAATDNIKTDFGQGEKIKKLSKEIQLKSVTLAYENFFLYDNENMITETIVKELNKKLSTFGLVSFSVEAKDNNKSDLITQNRKLKFNMKKDVYKSRIYLNLGEVHTKTSFSTTRNNVLNFGLICPKKNKSVGEKRTMSQEIIKTVHGSGLQNFIIYERMNPVEIMLDSNEIVEDLSKYKRFKYRFLLIQFKSAE